MNITRDLERAVAGIAKVPEKEIATDGKAAFEAFRLAFEKAKAEAERTETNLEDIMSVVTQRTEVLSFLIRVHGAKKMLQKRAIIILMLLVEMDVWREDLKDNRELMDLLPKELHELFEDDAAATSAVKGGATAEFPDETWQTAKFLELFGVDDITHVINQKAWEESFDRIAKDGIITRKAFVIANGPPELFDYLRGIASIKQPSLTRDNFMKAFDILGADGNLEIGKMMHRAQAYTEDVA